MKYTEGAFRNWAYDIAMTTYKDKCFTYPEWKEVKEKNGIKQADKVKSEAIKAGKIFIDEAITDVVFAKAILSPQKFDILVTTNLNGDYLSDAFAALTGGVGISPGANINFENGTGVFEANHGSAQDIANRDKANPSSIILSGAMMFDFMGWQEAGDLIRRGIEETIRSRNVTYDLFQSSLDFNLVGTTSFGELVINNMEK
jgi:isocitrate dehydrogenase